MAYHGYISKICEYACVLFNNEKRAIKILEIGIDTGISMFAINNNLNLLSVPFKYTGLDIHLQPHISVIDYTFLQKYNKNKNKFIKINSLEYLKNCNEKFDIIMIDGDHNYQTVYKELSYLEKVSHKNTLVVCDDYNGRWAKRDLYYSEREGYEENDIATKKIESDKKGVATAIDEFLEENLEYQSFFMMPGEPICIIKKENEFIKIGTNND
jgi:predicted O-methyltransferase YrrM